MNDEKEKAKKEIQNQITFRRIQMISQVYFSFLCCRIFEFQFYLRKKSTNRSREGDDKIPFRLSSDATL